MQHLMTLNSLLATAQRAFPPELVEPEQVAIAPAAQIISAMTGILLTLYMMAILLRWLGPWLELSDRALLMRGAALITDPLIRLMRRILPPMGPMDWGPLAALVVVWLVRLLLVRY